MAIVILSFSGLYNKTNIRTVYSVTAKIHIYIYIYIYIYIFKNDDDYIFYQNKFILTI